MLISIILGNTNCNVFKRYSNITPKLIHFLTTPLNVFNIFALKINNICIFFFLEIGSNSFPVCTICMATRFSQSSPEREKSTQIRALIKFHTRLNPLMFPVPDDDDGDAVHTSGFSLSKWHGQRSASRPSEIPRK